MITNNIRTAPKMIFDIHKMNAADLLQLLLADVEDQFVAIKIPLETVCGIVQGIRRESGDGRQFLIDLDTETGKRSLFVRLD